MVSQLRVSRSSLPQRSARIHHHPLLHTLEGNVQVFTSAYRNFFTNVMVQALRTAGQGTPVLVVQFLKGGIGQGIEHPVLLGQNLVWLRPALTRCIHTAEVDGEERSQIQSLWHHTQQIVMQGKYTLLVLDELSLAIEFGLVPELEVLAFLHNRPAQVDVILTGPKMPEAVLETADQVTQLRRHFNTSQIEAP